MRLEELVQSCTVKLSSVNAGSGTGFLIAPGYILTCEHVVRGAAKSIQVRWQQKTKFSEATVFQIFPDYDVALLSFDSADESLPYVLFDEERPEVHDRLYLFGYGNTSENGDPVTVEVEGMTGDRPTFIKYKLGGIKPGMSGAALINFRTGKVCGMSKFTVDEYNPQGGGGIPISTLVDCLPSKIISSQRQFHKRDSRWLKSQPLHWTEAPPSIKRRALISLGFFTTVGFGSAFLLNKITKKIDPFALDIKLKLRKEKRDRKNKLVYFNTLTINSLGDVSQANSPGQNQYRIEKCGECATIELRKIPEGQFVIGTLDRPLGARTDDEQPPNYPIHISPFWMGMYPITQRQWKSVSKLNQIERPLPTNFSESTNGDNPVVNISWLEAVEFCKRLTKATNNDKCEYRLPSEAQWEYACRANTKTPFHFGPKLIKQLANYDRYRFGVVPVDHFKWANAFGLYQMHGNVWEWCQDIKYDDYNMGIPPDGRPWVSDNLEPSVYRRGENSIPRVMRGGGWDKPQDECRSTVRGLDFETERRGNTGFRIVCINHYI